MKIKDLKEKLEIGYFEEEVLLDALLEILGNPHEEDDFEVDEIIDNLYSLKEILEDWIDKLENAN